MKEKYFKLPSEFVKKVKDTLVNKETLEGELKETTIDGKEYWYQNSVMPILDENDKIIGEVIVRYDITEKKVFEKLSVTDPLTLLYNRRYFNEILTREINRAKRENSSLSFIVLDIDYFKKYNDSNGHKAGDNALVSIANTLKDSLGRGGDFAFRLGGEEFGVIFSRQSKESSLEFAQFLRKQVEDLKIIHSASEVSKYVTISLGLLHVDFSEVDINEDGFYTMADDALYLAKKRGRNRVAIHESEDLELF